MMLFSNFLNRTLSSTIARTPSIRFRYGASRDQKITATAPSGGPGAPPGAAPGQSGEPIFDFQVPQRWRRRPISDEEIAYINRGGPE